jgi:hypothetical protein
VTGSLYTVGAARHALVHGAEQSEH